MERQAQFATVIVGVIATIFAMIASRDMRYCAIVVYNDDHEDVRT